MISEDMEQIITDYNGYLTRMADAARHFGEDLLKSNYREVSEVLPALITGLQWVNEALENFVLLGKIKDDQLISFRNVVTSMHETLENKDYVLLHDLLEYEVIPLLEKIRVGQIHVN